MKIAFYAPFKPLGHPNPSGDLIIATGLVQFLEAQGHVIAVQSRLRARWIYLKPWRWPLLVREFLRCLKRLRQNRPDVWLTYHTYYKAPDLLGPLVCRLLGIRYVIFQGIYSTKRKRHVKTFPGFYLNRFALRSASHVFTNKLSDYKNLKRIIPEDSLTYVRPGIRPDEFVREDALGRSYRNKWQVGETPVILSAAMFRDDVKTKGLAWLIQCCGKLMEKGLEFCLVIAGSGKMEGELKRLAAEYLPGHHVFAGKIPRDKMYRFYSAGDIFAFPGIRESLGMVFLEAQSCSLPVVAFENGGIPEVVADKKTGYLVPMYDCRAFSDIVAELLADRDGRERMGTRAAGHVRAHHDRDMNYQKFEQILERVSG